MLLTRIQVVFSQNKITSVLLLRNHAALVVSNEAEPAAVKLNIFFFRFVVEADWSTTEAQDSLYRHKVVKQSPLKHQCVTSAVQL